MFSVNRAEVIIGKDGGKFDTVNLEQVKSLLKGQFEIESDS